MSKVDTVATIAAILVATDDLTRTPAKVEFSNDPARFVDDALAIYEAARSRVRDDESRKRYGRP